MRQRFDVWFNNVSLLSVCPNAYIHDIQYEKAQVQPTTKTKPKGHGLVRTSERIERSIVRVYMEVHEYSTVERQNAFQELSRWAMGEGVLEVSDRPGQILYCSCSSLPMVVSALQWTDAVEITFTAYEIPFWTDKIINYVTINKPDSSTVTGKIWGAGIADDPYLEGIITVKSGTVTQVTVNVVGVGWMVLDNLNVSSNHTIEFGTDRTGIFYARSDGVGLLSGLSASSADNLRLKRGKENQIAFAAQGASSLTLKVGARGLYY